MKRFFLGAFLLVLLLYLLAQFTLQENRQPGVLRLRWATDPNPARQEQARLFARLHPGIEVAVEPIETDKIIVQCATGTGPDLIDVYSVQQMATYVAAGILRDLTAPAQRLGFSPQRTYPALARALMIEGRQYRCPAGVTADCVVYNKAVFDDHAVPYPRPDWTYDDFVAAARQIKDKPARSEARHIPLARWSTTWLFNDLLIGYGGRYFSPDGLICRLDSPAARAALHRYYEMIVVYRIAPTVAESRTLSAQGGWHGGSLGWFTQGKAGMIIVGRWISVLLGHYPHLVNKLGVVPLPRAAGRPSAGMITCRGTGINVKSTRQDAALLFLQYLAGPDYGRLIVRDGDGLPPDPSLARTGRDLVTSTVPDPCFHQPFVQAVARARPLDVSPFVDPALVERRLAEHLERIENGLEAPPAALQAVAGEINRQIRLNLQRRPDLRRKYEDITARPYRPDWYEHYPGRRNEGTAPALR